MAQRQKPNQYLPFKKRGNHAFADLRYGKEDSISPSTLIVAATKGYFGIYTLHIPPDTPSLNKRTAQERDTGIVF